MNRSTDGTVIRDQMKCIRGPTHAGLLGTGMPCQALFLWGVGVVALRRAIIAARRRPRSHGIRVLQAAASVIIVVIQRRWVFILPLRLGPGVVALGSHNVTSLHG